MSVISEEWIQAIAERIRLPALDPRTVKALIPAIELHAKQLAIQAEKFRRRAKSRILTADEINEALMLNKKETLYGVTSTSSDASLNSIGTVTTSNSSNDAPSTSEIMQGRVDLATMVKRPLPPTPRLPDLHLHYLVVLGVQPLVMENPVIEVQDEEEMFLSSNLSKEAKELFVKIVRTLTNSTDEGELVKIRDFLCSKNPALPILLPYITQCFHGFGKIHANNVGRLRILVKSMEALLYNPHIDLKPHFGRHVVPCILSVVVGSRVGSGGAYVAGELDDQFALKTHAAKLMYFICYRYGDDIEDLTMRVCKTYLEALSSNKEVRTDISEKAAAESHVSKAGGGSSMIVSNSSSSSSSSSSLSSSLSSSSSSSAYSAIHASELMDIINNISGKTLDTVYGGLQGLYLMGTGPIRMMLKPVAGSAYGHDCLWSDVYSRLMTVLKYSSGRAMNTYVASNQQKREGRRKMFGVFLNRYNSSNMCLTSIIQGLGLYIVDCFANIEISTTKKMVDSLLDLLKHVDLGEALFTVNNKAVNGFAIGHKKESINKGLDYFEFVI